MIILQVTIINKGDREDREVDVASRVLRKIIEKQKGLQNGY